MTDNLSLKEDLIYGLDISELDPYSPHFQHTTDLICLCQLYDRYSDELQPVVHNALLRAIERQCAEVEMPFESLGLSPRDEGDWLARIDDERYQAQQRYQRLIAGVGESDDLSEAEARIIAEQKLEGSGLVLRGGVAFHDGSSWRFPTRLSSEPDEPYDGQEMTVLVRVGPEDRLAGAAVDLVSSIDLK